MGDPLSLAIAFAAGALVAFFIGRATAKPRALAPQLTAPPPPPALAAEQVHASGLYLLGLLQREGRLIDFLQEDLASAQDADVGAAARVVHQGCRKVLGQYVTIAPALQGDEGATVQVPQGFDAGRIRLVGAVSGSPPFRGVLKHRGWVATAVSLPTPPTAVDPRVLAPAEVELS